MAMLGHNTGLSQKIHEINILLNNTTSISMYNSITFLYIPLAFQQVKRSTGFCMPSEENVF
jgi:hypothetical protein